MSLTKALLIIPMYNEEKRVDINQYEEAFEHYKHIDFLLVNDSSTDETSAVINNFIKNYENIN